MPVTACRLSGVTTVDLIAVAQHRAQRHHAAIDLGADTGCRRRRYARHRQNPPASNRAAKRSNRLSAKNKKPVPETIPVWCFQGILPASAHARRYPAIRAASDIAGRRCVDRRPPCNPNAPRRRVRQPHASRRVRICISMRWLLGPDDAGMQALILVGLRCGDVILKTSRHDMVTAVDDAERLIALLDSYSTM